MSSGFLQWKLKDLRFNLKRNAVCSNSRNYFISIYWNERWFEEAGSYLYIFLNSLQGLILLSTGRVLYCNIFLDLWNFFNSVKVLFLSHKKYCFSTYLLYKDLFNELYEAPYSIGREQYTPDNFQSVSSFCLVLLNVFKMSVNFFAFYHKSTRTFCVSRLNLW